VLGNLLSSTTRMTMDRATICNRCGAQIPVAEAHWHQGVEYCDRCDDMRVEAEYGAYETALILGYLNPSASFVARARFLCKMTLRSLNRKRCEVFSWIFLRVHLK
jgi:hypothetical protein